MKFFFLNFLILISAKSVAQNVNFCNYFGLEVDVQVTERKTSKRVNPYILKDQDDAFSEFLKDHSNRFEYILYKYLPNFSALTNYYPDTNRIQQEFCDSVLKLGELNNYFIHLTPKNLVTWNADVDTFSMHELMLVASKFFYCDEINKKDTTIQTHICIGINGQNEYKSDRDLTLLEAFSLEVIFSNRSGAEDPPFYGDFYSYKRQIEKEKLSEFKDFESYLLNIRTLCYEKMIENVNLKYELMEYYIANKSNLGFVIL